MRFCLQLDKLKYISHEELKLVTCDLQIQTMSQLNGFYEFQ